MPKHINSRSLKPLITSAQITTRVSELGAEITTDYRDKNPLLIGVLKGGFIFLADLVRHIATDVEVDFIRTSSYKNGMTPGDLELITDTSIPVKNRHVLIIEDLIDTGVTLSFIMEHLKSKEPASLKVCTLINKHERLKIDIKPEYIGFDVKSGFIIGYGTDWGEKGRNYPDIYVVE